MSIPYTFADRDHFWNFADSDLAPEFLLEPVENGSGIRGLFYGEEGFRHFFGTEPLNSIEDLDGLKIRVSNDPIARGMVQGLGADPTVVNYNELYSALQSGVVDAAEQPIANYYSRSFYEAAPYMILDGHTLGAIQVIITEDAWNALSADQRDAVMEAGRIASAFNRELSEGAEREILEQLAAAAATIVDVDDKSAWREAVADVIETATSDNRELYRQILDLR